MSTDNQQGTIEDTAQLETEVFEAYNKQGKITNRAIFFIKLVLVLFGSSMATIGSLMDFTHSKQIGIGGAIAATIGGIFLLITGKDTFSELNVARKAIKRLQSEEKTLQIERQKSEEMRDAIDLMQYLYSALLTALGSLKERSPIHTQQTIELIDYILRTSGELLEHSFGFKSDDNWTICVYQALAGEDGRTYMTLVSHRRKTPCRIESAKKWPEGQGVGGWAYSNDMEIIVQDSLDPSQKNIFDTNTELFELEFLKRYRSMAAIPVNVGQNGDRPWGVIVTTSSVPFHFGRADHHGLHPEEGARTLSKLVAMIVAATNTTSAG